VAWSEFLVGENENKMTTMYCYVGKPVSHINEEMTKMLIGLFFDRDWQLCRIDLDDDIDMYKFKTIEEQYPHVAKDIRRFAKEEDITILLLDVHQK